tara:strand:+ start:612 stop:749 length:138 start_codon:yes stop_codon:yes gene_type:complete
MQRFQLDRNEFERFFQQKRRSGKARHPHLNEKKELQTHDLYRLVG